MEVVQTTLSGIPVLRIVGEVDHANSSEVDAAAKAALALGGSRLLVDLTDCSYIDSAGLGVLLSVHKMVQDTGWLGVIGAKAGVLRLLEIVGLTTGPSFRLFSDVQEASATLAGISR
jgi:anti-anti-sigma factor